MDEKGKESLINRLKESPRGAVGLLAADMERVLVMVPTSIIDAALALELIMESQSRHHNLKTPEEWRALTDLVREYARGLSDEEFNQFGSPESINELMARAIEKLKKDSEGCDECCSCNECENDDEDPGSMMN